jgi:very-short-patch-repair endonuclease
MTRATVVRARELRKSMTRYEVKLWLRLRQLKTQGFRFRRQVPIGRWIADFACFTNRIVVEADGMQHGFEAEAARDALRDTFLNEQGFRVLRFTNNEIWENIDGVMEQIFAHRLMAAAFRSDVESVVRPPPDPALRSGPPSPQGGGMKGTP